ncbi:MAG: hypothetical protein NTV31_05255 [Bacteroidia bacterium]|nr:hypothetical protein [Bacteroidia bacterium]
MRKATLIHPEKRFLTGTIFKKYIFIFSLGFFSLGALANPSLASKQQIGMFKNSKTCVVLEDGINFYNAYIKDAVQKYWKSTEYEFIDQQEFEKRRSDSKYSFLVLMDGVYDKDPGGVSYSYMSLVLGDASNNMTRMPELCSIPLSYSGDKDVDYEYVIPAIVKFMQKHAKNLEKERFIISIKGLKYYNGSTGFKDKVLLLNKDKMASDADSPEKIKTVYPYYVKLLTTTEIQAEISTNPTNALFQFHVGPSENAGAGKCFDMIFDVEGNLYYYNYRKITNDNKDGFTLKDFYYLR